MNLGLWVVDFSARITGLSGGLLNWVVGSPAHHRPVYVYSYNPYFQYC